MEKTEVIAEGLNVEIITEQVKKKTFDGIMYELINWVVYTDENGIYHPIPYGQLYYEQSKFGSDEVKDYHNDFVKYFTENPKKYLCN
jgi:hypothetical protein